MDIQQYINSPANVTSFAKKGFNAKTPSVDMDGNYKNVALKPNNFKTKNIADIINFVLPNMATLANLNPRFNKFINPLYYIGLKGVGESSHLDYYKDKDSTITIDNKTTEIANKVSLLQGVPNRNSIMDYKVPQELKQSAKQYTELFVNPMDKSPKSYLESLVSQGKRRVVNLLDIANKSVDSLIPDFLQDVNNTVKNFTGADFLGLKDGFITQAEVQYLSNDSEDPFYSAKHGLVLGQTTGKAFRHAVGGFSNSYKEDFPNSYANQTQQQLNKLAGQSTKNDVAGHWHLPYTDPTEYSVDERRKYATKIKPDDRLSVMTSLMNNIGSDVDAFNKLFSSPSDIYNTVNKTMSNIDIGGIPNLIGNVFSGDSGIDTKALLNTIGNGTSTFARGMLSDKLNSFGNDNTIDNLSDLFAGGSDATNNFTPLLVQESHKNYINTSPIGIPSKWWSVDNDNIYQEKVRGFFDNVVLELNATKSGINLKKDKKEKAKQLKEGELSSADKMIYEGVQQFDGSYDGVNYNANGKEGFAPQNSRADIDDQTYFANIRQSKVNKILGEPDKGQKRDYSKNPQSGWIAEPQFFPFYFRTLNRDDYAVVQQPIYDNGAVFMSKKKVTANSIVFLECAIDSIAESFAHTINKENYLGRTEPVLSYAGSNRSFSLSFYIMSTSPKDVPSLRAKVNELIRMSYPQVMALNDIGVLGYRRVPMVEWRIGDQWLLQGAISNITPDWMIGQNSWEIIPGGRVLKFVKLSMSFEITHWEQPNASTDFYSPTFSPSVFFEGHRDTGTSQAKALGNSQSQNALQSAIDGFKGSASPEIPNINFKDILNDTTGGFNTNNVVNNLPSFP